MADRHSASNKAKADAQAKAKADADAKRQADKGDNQGPASRPEGDNSSDGADTGSAPKASDTGRAYQADDDGPTDEEVQEGFATLPGSSDPVDRTVDKAAADGTAAASVESMVKSAKGDPFLLLDAFVSAAGNPPYSRNQEIQRMVQVYQSEQRGMQAADKRLKERAVRKQEENEENERAEASRKRDAGR